MIRTAVVLPTFRDAPDEAFAAADEAVQAGVDGLFCYDHIWPLGQPERPAIAPFPVLGALAARLAPRADGNGPFLGTLVARIGLAPLPVLAAQFAALEDAGERVPQLLADSQRPLSRLSFGVTWHRSRPRA